MLFREHLEPERVRPTIVVDERQNPPSGGAYAGVPSARGACVFLDEQGQRQPGAKLLDDRGDRSAATIIDHDDFESILRQ